MPGKKAAAPRLAKRHGAGSARRKRLTRPTPKSNPHHQHSLWQATTRRPRPTGGRGGPPLPTPPPAPRTRHGQRWPDGGGRWERETTLPARLRAPETTWSAPGAPRRATRNALSTPKRVSSAAPGRPSPWRGGPRTTRSQGRQARVSAASGDPGPASAVRQNTGGRGRAGACTPPPHPPPHRHGGQR